MGTKTSNLFTYRLRNFAKDRMPLSVTFQRWKGGDASPEHLHDSMEIIYVVKGDGVNFIDGLAYPIIAGDIYIVNCGSTHSFRAGGGLVIYNLMFHPSAFSPKELQLLRSTPRFDSFFRFSKNSSDTERPHGKLFLPPPFSEKFKDLFERLYRETVDAGPGWRMNSKAYLILILTEICRTRLVMSEGGEDGDTGSEPPPLARVMAFINANFLRELSLAEIADAGGLSRTYISEFFHTKTGMHLVKYITSLRLEKARQRILSEGNLSIVELAKSCGFKDPCYFTKVFRETLGVTPSAYRKIPQSE
jgi:AraC-like DNA-binding protein